ILHVLYEQLLKYTDRVDRYEEWFTTSLMLDDDGTCVGCVARDIRSGAMETFNAKNGILASGGAGQCFKPTTNALICTGDGIAQAYRVGAPLMDMEMVQYHPTTLVENGFLITEGARGEGAHLLNGDGDRFMENYAPNKLELASRDVVSRAEQTEINEGRGAGPDGNRPGANSLLDTLIFGRRAGEHAAKRALSMPMPEGKVGVAELARDAEEIEQIISRPRTGRRISAIKDELGETMNRYAAVFRDD